MKDWKVIFEPVMKMMFLYSDTEKLSDWQKLYESILGTSESDGSSGGRFVGLSHTVMGDREMGLIWCPNSKPDVVAHETLHAVRWYLEERRHIPFSEDTDELYCYMQQFLVKEIYSKTRAGGIRLRKELTDEKTEFIPTPKKTKKRTTKKAKRLTAGKAKRRTKK